MKTKNLIAKIVIGINIVSYLVLVASLIAFSIIGRILVIEVSVPFILIFRFLGSISWFLLPAVLSYFCKEYRKRFVIILIINLFIAAVIFFSFGYHT